MYKDHWTRCKRLFIFMGYISRNATGKNEQMEAYDLEQSNQDI
jgi:hypothetical protein